MAKAAEMVGTLAKEKQSLSRRLTGTTAKTKGLIVKWVLLRDTAAGLVIGSVFLILCGAFAAMAKLLDPPLAAAAVGGVTLLIVVALTAVALRLPKP